MRLPSSNRRLIRASITDITERKRAEAIAAGERRVFEKIAANAPLPAVLEAIAEVIERVVPDSFCAINLLDAGAPGPALRRRAAACRASSSPPWITRRSACATARARRRCYLARQVLVADIEADALWECRRDAARQAGLRAAWSAPIIASDGQVIGTFAVYRRQPRHAVGRAITN